MEKKIRVRKILYKSKDKLKSLNIKIISHIYIEYE